MWRADRGRYLIARRPSPTLAKRRGYFFRVYWISIILNVFPSGVLLHISSMWWSLSVMVIFSFAVEVLPVAG